LAEIIRDLSAEHESLESSIGGLPEEARERKKHADWRAVRDQVAHPAQFHEGATLAIRDEVAFRARARSGSGAAPTPSGEPGYLVDARKLSPGEVLEWWRKASFELREASTTMDPSRRMPWYGPPMAATSFITARLMECWSHGLDVVDVVAADRAPTLRLKHIAHLGVRTRNFSYVTRGLEPNAEPVRVELFAPDGEVWLFGDPASEQIIKGPADEFCMVVTQRRNVADTNLEVVGPAATEWMQYAQAFAGPAGKGRKPGQFQKRPVFHP
jgi:uncharacterized protein (TIGR03084 family)